MDARDLLPMGEISRRSGFAASAIRYYEAEGLIEAHRSGGGQRRFERSVLRRLAFIRAASNVGLSIDEIRDEVIPRITEIIETAPELAAARPILCPSERPQNEASAALG